MIVHVRFMTFLPSAQRLSGRGGANQSTLRRTKQVSEPPAVAGGYAFALPPLASNDLLGGVTLHLNCAQGLAISIFLKDDTVARIVERNTKMRQDAAPKLAAYV